MFFTEKNYNKLINDGYTFFLRINEYNKLKGKIKNLKYNIYKPYKDSEKIICYKNKIPNISLYKILTNNKLKHQEILGSILGLGIDDEVLGDIIIINNNYYFYIFSTMDNYIISNLNKIGNYNIKLEKIDNNYLENYEKDYERIELIVSSLRIDTVISRLININRDKIKDFIKNKYILLNYELLKNNSYKLKENDIFSIRRYGKYKYNKIINTTKKNNYIIEIYKY